MGQDACLTVTGVDLQSPPVLSSDVFAGVTVAATVAEADGTNVQPACGPVSRVPTFLTGETRAICEVADACTNAIVSKLDEVLAELRILSAADERRQPQPTVTVTPAAVGTENT